MVRQHHLGRKARYEDYMHTQEWRDLRARKLAITPACEVCFSHRLLHIHHLKYAPPARRRPETPNDPMRDSP